MYSRVDELDAGLEFDGLGVAAAPGSRVRTSVVPRLERQLAVANAPVDHAVLRALRDRRLRQILAMRSALRSRPVVAKPLLQRAAVLKGFGSSASSEDAARSALERFLDSQEDFENLDLSTADLVGRSMLLSRAAEIASSTGIDTSFDELVNSSVDQLAFLRGIVATPSGRDGLRAVAQQVFGSQVWDSFDSQGGSLSQLVDVASSLRSKFGSSWDDMRQVIGNLSGIMEGGVRETLESVFGAGGGVPQWLNAQTVSSVVGIARTWSSVNTSQPGAIVGAVGSTLTLAGAACPPPANAIVCAVGGIVSLAGVLANLFGGSDYAAPSVQPCDFTSLIDPDAWATLRLYQVASGGDPGQGLEDLKNEWGVRFDPYTGEVLAQTPGSNGYRRLLDVYDRKVLLDAYKAGAFDAWLMGTQSINGADPINVHGNPWLSQPSTAPYWKFRSLYCALRKNADVGTRGYASAASSTARRYRVFSEEYGNKVDTRTDHGPMAISKAVSSDWGASYGQVATEPFWIQYRAAQLITAFLGGTAPYGRYDNGRVCTGVGGKLMPGRTTYPFTCNVPTYSMSGRIWPMLRGGRAATRSTPEIILTAPMERAFSAPGLGTYRPASTVVSGISFEEVGDTILRDDNQRIAWNVPAATPGRGEMEPLQLVRFWRPSRELALASFLSTPKSGESGFAWSAGKVLLGTVVLGGVVYGVYRLAKRTRGR